MKSYIYLILLFVFSCIDTFAQQTFNLGNSEYLDYMQNTFPTRNIVNTDDGIIITYYFENITVYPDSEFVGARTVHIDGFGDNMIEEEPLFPVRYDTYGNFKGEFHSITMVDSSFIDIPMELSPARKPLMESKELLTIEQTKPIKSYDGFFPSTTISYCELGQVKNRQLLKMRITPVLYDHTNKTARFFKKISFKISTGTESHLYKTSSFSVDNYLNNITENQVVTNYTRTDTVETINNDYLIITTSGLEPAVSLFAEWKRTLGYNTQIVSRDVWDVDAIKAIIGNFYNADHFQYLLFVGDENIIPPSGYEYYSANGKTFYFPYDLDYLKFDNNDHSLDIIMGRLPVSNMEEARVIFKKIQNYELNPDSTTSFYNNVLLSTYFQDSESNPGYASHNYVESTEEVRTYLIAKEKTVNRVYFTESNVIPLYYQIGHPVPNELRKPGVAWDGDSADIKELIDDGTFLAIHRDHGWETRWYAPKYDTNDISSLVNGTKLPVVFSIDCQTGEYDYQDEESFVEAFLKHNDGGCVGIIAASGVTYTTPNNYLLKALIDVIWPNPGIMDSNIYEGRTPVYKLGEILYQGLARANPYYPQIQNKKLYHCFGDPSMRIYTSKPSVFENINVVRNTNNVYVNTNNDETEIAIYNKSDGNISLFKGRSVTVPCDPNNTIVTISAPNKITYVDSPYATAYIQNQRVIGYRTYSTTQIYSGSYVDLNRPFGNVVFSGGLIELNNSSIEINGQTTIESNTSFTISNSN